MQAVSVARASFMALERITTTQTRARSGGPNPTRAKVHPNSRLAGTFEDDFFTHSFSSFLIGGLKNRLDAAKHIYRTVQPGGKAIITLWSAMPHDLPLKHAHAATREADAELAIKWGGTLHDSATLKSFLVSGGFDEESVEIHTHGFVHEVADLKEWIALLWSYIGMREGEIGWTVEDEERWDEAVGIALADLEASELVERGPDGGMWKLKFPCNIVIGTKN